MQATYLEPERGEEPDLDFVDAQVSRACWQSRAVKPQVLAREEYTWARDQLPDSLSLVPTATLLLEAGLWWGDNGSNHVAHCQPETRLFLFLVGVARCCGLLLAPSLSTFSPLESGCTICLWPALPLLQPFAWFAFYSENSCFFCTFFFPPVMFLPPSNPRHWWHGNHFRYLRLKLFLSEVTCSHQDNWGEPFLTASRAGLISLLPRLGPGWTISTSLASCELAPASKRDGGDEAMMDRSCLVTLKVFRMLLCFQALSLAGKALLHQATCTKTCSSVSPLVAPFNRIFHSWAVSGTISWVVDAAVQ